MSAPHESYESPLASRYASGYMLRLFSPKARAVMFRRLWASLALAEHKLGLPVSASQVEELYAHTDDIDFELIAEKEKELRHDVMAHIHAYGAAAPSAAGIIHLGATSCYVTDNADLIIYRDALRYIRGELLCAIRKLCGFASRYKAVPALGYTHFQPAQPVTVGKRATLWIQDLCMDLEALDHFLASMRMLGCRGATGTEASFMELFNGEYEKIDRMNAMIAEEFGFDGVFDVCGQTYPRKIDSQIQSILSGICESACRFAGDIRLLQHERELEEPLEAAQVGSSAMPYKRNPMRSERVCALGRYVIANASNAPMTASAQWLERTLDDSANRRIAMPEAFLAVDAVLRLVQNIASGLVVNEKVIAHNLNEYLPFMASENILMEAVRRGGDRQVLHERIRRHSAESVKRMREGESCDLLDRLKADPEFGISPAEMDSLVSPAAFTGRAKAQTEAFLEKLSSLEEGVSVGDIAL